MSKRNEPSQAKRPSDSEGPLNGLSVGETIEDNKTKLRELAKNDLYFLSDCLGFHDLYRPLHGPLCEWIQKPVPGKLLLLPRGHFKTSIYTQADTIRLLLQEPNRRILIANAVFQGSKEMLYLIKRWWEENFFLHNFFPELIPPFKTRWSEEQLQIKRPNDYNEASIEIAGVGASLAGRHYDILKKDDLVTRENTTTRLQRDKVADWHRFSISLFDQPEKRTDHIVGTRYSFDDLYGRIIAGEELAIYDYWRLSAIKDGKPIFPTRFSHEGLEQLKHELGSYIFSCTPGESPVWMGDGTLKPIKDVQVGDEVVGFEFGPGKRRKLVLTRVTQKNSRVAPVMDITTDSGFARATADHQWFTGYYEANAHRVFAPVTVEKRHGFTRKMVRVLDLPKPLSVEQRIAYAYLGGLLDGEGCCTHGSLVISQSPKSNPEVCEWIEKTLRFLKIPFSKLPSGNSTTLFTIRGGRQVKCEILWHTNCAKGDQIMRNILRKPYRMVIGEDRVKEIKPSGEEEVFALTTESGNYVVWGYASKNCQYMNEPLPEGEQDFTMAEQNYYREKPEYSDSEVFMGVDPAVSESTKADYTAMVVTATDPEGNVYVLDYIRERLLPNKLIEKLFDFYAKWKPRRMAIEKEAFQVALNQWIRQEAAKRGTSLPLYEVVQPRDKSKEMRIRGLQPRWEAGALKIAPWMRDLEAELTSFPRGQHDDLLDALVMQHEFWPINFPTAEAKRAEGMLTMAAILDEIKNRGGQSSRKMVHLRRRSSYEHDAPGSEEGSNLQIAPFRQR